MSTRAILWWVLLGSVAVLGSACVTSNASRCNNDLICPSGMACSPAGDSCVDADLVDACHGGADGKVCQVAGLPPGTCLAGICQANRCGDGRVTGSEDCDGTLLGTKTCQSFGFYDAAGLRCGPDCRYDTTQCTGRCGDGIKNGSEQCDGKDLGNATCFTAGYYAAKGLACKADCTFDTKACTGGRCGDGILNGLEQCDGKASVATCATMGFIGAMSGVACTSSCTYAATSCLCSSGRRCTAKTQKCVCDKLGCGCVAAP